VKLGISSLGKNLDPESKGYLTRLMDKLEKEKTVLGARLGDGDQEYVKNFAYKVFKTADDQDRAGQATKRTAKEFLEASVFFEIYGQFEPLPKEMEDLKRYAKWKAVSIGTALKNGETPTPGPLGFTPDNDAMPGFDDMSSAWPNLNMGSPATSLQSNLNGIPSMGMSLQSNLNLPTNPPMNLPSVRPTLSSSPQLPQLSNLPPHLSGNQLPSSNPPPSFSNQFPAQSPSPWTSLPQPAPQMPPNTTQQKPTTLWNPTQIQHPQQPSNPVAQPPQHLQNGHKNQNEGNSIQQPQTMMSAMMEHHLDLLDLKMDYNHLKLSPERLAQATQHTRYALSALHFDDVPTALYNIGIALGFLTTNHV